MNCARTETVRLFVDDELQPSVRDEMAAHVAECPECSSAVAEQLAFKKLIRVAANRYPAPPALHAALHRQLHPQTRTNRWWTWGLSFATLAAILALGLAIWPRRTVEEGLVAELVDQHVIALSSANPVDVISDDRHTVKPWFQGKLPFTFNLPELAGSNVTLLGGKLVYLRQNPAAELLYQAGRHKISVFVLQAAPATKGPVASSSFNVKSWTANGLQFYLVTDGSDVEAEHLVTMLRDANQP